jgi:hypothetical protein
VIPKTKTYTLEAGKTYTIAQELNKLNDTDFIEPSIIEVK